MKTKKTLKKIENTIIKKKIKNFNFFTLEYCSNTKLFFKKTLFLVQKAGGADRAVTGDGAIQKARLLAPQHSSNVPLGIK